MKIRAADLFSLIESAWDKLQSEYGENHQSMNLDFFNSLARHIQHNSRNKYKLKGATLYKQYYLKIKEDALESQSDFIGTGYFERYYNVFYEATWVDWRNLEFSSEDIFENDFELPASVMINQEISNKLNPILSHHLGIALHLPILPIHIYAGYQYLPVAFLDVYNSDLRQSYSTGFSYMIQENFSIQGSYVKYFWKYGNEPEHFEKLSVGIAMHY